MAKRRGVSYKKRVEDINRIYDRYVKSGSPEPGDMATVHISGLWHYRTDLLQHTQCRCEGKRIT